MAKSKELSGEEFSRLLKEFETLKELEQHDKVSKLSSKMCISLIELLDEELSDKDHDEKMIEIGVKCSTSDFIQNLCDSIFLQGKIAAAYAEIRDFVRLRDLVCFSRLVGAIPDKSHEDKLIIDFECLARILRQSIFLLKCINESPASSSFPEELGEDHKSRYIWLDRNYTNSVRLQNHSFPIYCIDSIGKCLVKLNSNQISRPSKVVDQLKSYERSAHNSTNRRSDYIFSSSWFQEFVIDNLSKGYPLSRFTILVAIWIVAVDCNHKVLEQLISELIDQIYHEEANSNSEEELLQLTQVGSFWLTYYKKHEATIRQVSLSETYDNDNDGERSSFGDDDDVISTNSSSSSNSSVSLFHNSGIRNDDVENDDVSIINEKMKDQGDSNKSVADLKSRLRHIIDDEFLHGVKCIICSYEPSELFEPLNTSCCPKCLNLKPVERCSLSYRPLDLVCLESLMNFKTNISKLLLVSPNEWTRYLIAPKLATLRAGIKLAKSGDLGKDNATLSASADDNDNDNDGCGDNNQTVNRKRQQQEGEHVVVAENYERLTVIRRDINQVRQKVDSSEDDDEERESSTSSRSSATSFSSSSSRYSSLLQGEENESLNYEDKNKFTQRKVATRRLKRDKRRKEKLTGNQRMDGDTYISTFENYMKVRLRKHPQDKTIRIGHTNSSSLSETIEMFKMISTSTSSLNSISTAAGATNNNQSNTLLPVCLTDLLVMDTSHDGGMFKIALVTSNNKLFESGSLWSCSNRSSISKLRLGCGSVFTSLELIRLGLQSANNEFTCPHCECQPLFRLRKLNEQL